MEIGRVIYILGEIGLTTYESKVYLSLLGRSSSTVSEIAIDSGLPRSQIYNTLKRLMVKGFCSAKPGKIQRYSATDPKIALKGYTEYLREAEIKRDEKIKELIGILKPQFEEGREEASPLEYIELLKDRKRIREMFLRLEREATREILMFTKAPYTAPLGQLKAEFDALSEAVSRGVKAKSIYEYEEGTKGDFIGIDTIDAFVSLGEEARIIKELPIKLAIFDERRVMLALNDPVTSHPSITTLVIEHSGLAKALKETFNGFWKKATPFEREESVRRKA